MGGLYAQFGMFMLLVAIVSVYKYGRNTQSLLWRRTFIVSSIVIVLMIALDIKFDITPASEIENNNPPPPKTEQPVVAEQKFFGNGQFKVGADLPVGEYIAIGTGYVEVATTPEGGSSIVVNDNIVDAQRYITAQAGEYVKLTGDIKLYPSSDAPKIKVDKNLPAGQFKCGTDIAAGEYKISLDAGGYFAVTRTTGNDYVKNQFTNEGGSFYATVSDGQFLQIKKGTGELVGTGTPPALKVEQTAEKPKSTIETKPTPPPAPPKVLNLGMTLTQFQDAFAAKASQFGLDGVDLYGLTIEDGNVQNVFRADDVSGVFAIQGTLDKQSGLVKEVWILIQPRTSDDMMTGIIVYGLFSHVLNPELSQNERGKLMDELHLSKNVQYLQTHTATAVRGNVKYSASLIQGGVYMLVASAKDI